MQTYFFPFDPRRARAYLFVGACLLAILCAWALADLRSGQGFMAEARVGMSLGLLLAFGVALFRLRPRPGWGITVASRGLSVARPFSLNRLDLHWGQVAQVERLGRDRQAVLSLRLHEEGRVVISRRLFANEAEFQALAQVLEERVTPVSYDA